jgi:hypothetical protein
MPPVSVSAMPISVNTVPISETPHLFHTANTVRLHLIWKSAAKGNKTNKTNILSKAESTINNVMGYGDHKVRYGDLGPDYCGIWSWFEWRWIVALDPGNLKVVLLKLGSKGITEADAIIFVQALETKKCKNKYATIMDAFLISWCSIWRQQVVNHDIVMYKEDLDISCFISLDVLSVDWKTYGRQRNFWCLI